MNRTHRLATELATKGPFSEEIDGDLCRLDEAELNGVSDEEWEQEAERITVAHLLHGDFERVIDLCLGGDLKLKKRIMEADQSDRGGLNVLKHHLRKRGAEVPADAASALRSLELDQQYYEQMMSNPKNIEALPSGSYRVKVKGRRETFLTLVEAVKSRELAWFEAS